MIALFDGFLILLEREVTFASEYVGFIIFRIMFRKLIIGRKCLLVFSCIIIGLSQAIIETTRIVIVRS